MLPSELAYTFVECCISFDWKTPWESGVEAWYSDGTVICGVEAWYSDPAEWKRGTVILNVSGSMVQSS